MLALTTFDFDLYLNKSIPYGPEWDPLIYYKLWQSNIGINLRFLKDKEKTMKYYLELGADGLIVNSGKNAQHVLYKQLQASHRFATVDDEL